MINDVIAKFVEGGHLSQNPLKIEFKKRNSIHGIFVKSPDYEDLKSKNFWRIVGEANIGEWQKTHDNNLAKIFNGSEFNRLVLPKKVAAVVAAD
jgi:hypothetical protein